jgi:hypothetical protein
MECCYLHTNACRKCHRLQTEQISQTAQATHKEWESMESSVPRYRPTGCKRPSRLCYVVRGHIFKLASSSYGLDVQHDKSFSSPKIPDRHWGQLNGYMDTCRLTINRPWREANSIHLVPRLIAWVDKCYKNLWSTSKFWVPQGWHDTSSISRTYKY